MRITKHTARACGAATGALFLAALAGGALGAHHTLAERIATDARPEADRARDAGRKPAEVLGFLGVEAGMDVLDVMAAGGWYTEVLSHAVGEAGTVTAQNPDAMLEFRDGANDKALAARMGRLPNASRLDKNFDEISADDGPFDAAISALNFHDIYNSEGRDAAVAMMEAVRSVLEPGGVFGVIDHAGNAGADNASLHRIEKSKVIDAAQAAGFIVDAESDLLASAADDHTQRVFADDVRGRTDRFLIRLKKPAD